MPPTSLLGATISHLRGARNARDLARIDTLLVDGRLPSTLNGQYGNDLMNVGTAADLFFGGPGTDTVD